jgi:LacI family transcriptional regulator
MRRQRKSVALLIETSNAYARGILQGIIDYQQQHQHWSIYLPERERGAAPPNWLRHWQGDGIIARIETDEIATAVRATKLPSVDVSAARRLTAIPWVETDDARISALAAEHLLERGFERFAFCGSSYFNWSTWRSDGFMKAIEAKGKTVEVYDTSTKWNDEYSWIREKRRLSKWVQQLPKPIGVMASYDIQAQRILDVCRELEISVPDEVAVIGVDNDAIICKLSSPSLTSVIPDAQGAGRLAAELLDKMMHEHEIAPIAYLLPPLGIACRQSTDVYSVSDPDIAAAARYIRDHACEGIMVADVVGHIAMSRRVLESRFRKATGKTPHEAIVSQRLAKVAELLRDTDWTLESIAHRTGFEHAEYMSVAFRRAYKMPPSEYRRGHKPQLGEGG